MTSRGHDDGIRVAINGTTVYTHDAAHQITATSAIDQIWRGFLGTESTVDFRHREGNGGSFAVLDIEDITPIYNYISSPPVTICEGTSTQLSAFISITPSATFHWSASDPSAFSFSHVVGNNVFVTGLTNGNYFITCRAFQSAANCFIEKTVPITINPNPNTAAAASLYDVCVGEIVFLSATGANTYEWYDQNGVLFSTAYFTSVTATTTGSYMVKGNNNCLSIDAFVTINVTQTGLTGTEFGNGYWNIFAYKGNDINLTKNNLRGFYTVSSPSFDSNNQWAQALNPALAAGYIGCPVPNNQHTLIAKQTNFACGRYRIDIPFFDDNFQLYINGTLFATATGTGSRLNVWTGVLIPTSTVEFRWQDLTSNSRGAINLVLLPQAATETTWTGRFSDDWFNPQNWCNVVPDRNTDAFIPALGVANMPKINSAGAETKHITIENGASITIDPNIPIQIYGNWDNSGFLTAETNSQVFITGSNSTYLKENSLFQKLTIHKVPFTSVALQSFITINQELTLENGFIDLNGNTLTLENADPNSLVRIGNSYIRSERTDASCKICRRTDAFATVYLYPFGYSQTQYIPVLFDKKTTANATICIATYGTGQNNLPLPPSAPFSPYLAISQGGTADVLIDRWWDIQSSLDPLPAPYASIALSYRPEEAITLPPNPTPYVRIQHFDPNLNKWDAPYSPAALLETLGIGQVTAAEIRKFSPHVIILDPFQLPVEYRYFTAKPQKNQVLLEWETVWERNNAFFEIGRSTNGKDFYPIGTKLAQSAFSKYVFIDQKPLLGTNYYRLKQVDTDRKFEYSIIRAVVLEKLENLDLLIVPNPTTADNIYIRLNFLTNKPLKVLVLDPLGRQIYRNELSNSENGEYRLGLDKKLAQGVFYLQVQTEDKIWTRKLMIVE